MCLNKLARRSYLTTLLRNHPGVLLNQIYFLHNLHLIYDDIVTLNEPWHNIVAGFKTESNENELEQLWLLGMPTTAQWDISDTATIHTSGSIGIIVPNVRPSSVLGRWAVARTVIYLKVGAKHYNAGSKL